MKHHRICSFLMAAALALLPVCALGESACETAQPDAREIAADARLEDAGLDLGIHSVRYPKLTGLDDAEIESAVNAQIVAAGEIDSRLNRLAAVMSLETPLRVTWQGTLENDVLSCAISALGPVYDGRETQVWRSVNVDTRTGEPITLAMLFADEAAAVEAIEAILTEQVATEMSAHLENSEVTPIPEAFYLTADGLALLYPIRQLSTLSGRAGTVTIRWHELRDVLALGEGSILRRIGAEESITLDENSAEKIRACAAAGRLPGIPAAIGDAIPALLDTYRELFDPDLFEGGKLITLEDGAFRRAYIITDALSEQLDNSIAQGIRADDLCFYGLCTGETAQEAWRSVLGEPDATLTLDADRAEAYRLVPGTSDYYTCGEYRLRLHADEAGVLQTVMLTQ